MVKTKKIKFLLLFAFIFTCISTHAQNTGTNNSKLTIEKIMQDPKWIGTSPGNINWSEDSKFIYFIWNPDKEINESLYKVSVNGGKPQKVKPEEKRDLPSRYGNYNKAKTKKIYTKNGDMFLLDIQSGDILQITNTSNPINSASFSYNEDKIIYTSNNNIFFWDIETGQTKQLTNFKSGQEKPDKPVYSNEQEKWLYDDQLKLFGILKKRKEKRELSQKEREQNRPKRPKIIYTGKSIASNIQLSPDGKYVTYNLYERPSNVKRTNVPNYVTESGFTEDITARTKAGTQQASVKMYIYDILNDTVYAIQTSKIPGIQDFPDYTKDYGKYKDIKLKERDVYISGSSWSVDGKNAIINVRSVDNKDRWIMLLDITNGELEILDRQRDEAWISGPGIGWSFSGRNLGWMPDNKKIWFQSEESGYSHIYTIDIKTKKKKALTKGKFEIYNPQISNDKKFWYFSSNEAHPGERHFYKMPIDGGKAIKLTSIEGSNYAALSPDESMIAIRYSFSNQPWDLYLMKNKEGAQAKKITNSLTDEFKVYNWKIPEVITFEARDGANVYARLYRPENPEKNGPAVIFVHGAGYLQNAHKWWSSYFREYMFHNFLVDNGYTVLDIDYRGSAGYGRDWRTAIYRHMGGKDLSDQVDGAKFLVEKYNVDPKRIGIYGGSYGGFITLMAMFTEPDIFTAGAALRSVTDWAHYSHGYTSNILNTPVEDSIAYIKSSPIYYAEGLKGALLICHGMIDTNVHFQDVVRLAQRLIELGKDNWEFAVYPVERHKFVEPSSWIDEYKRIFKLFENNL